MIRIPLLKDSHNHFFTYSALNNAIDLFYVTSKDEALKKIEKNKNQKFIVVKGWFDSYYSFESKDIENFPPLIIANNSLHNYIFNSKAKELINKTFPAWVVNNDNQEWVEKNIYGILGFISGLFPVNEKVIDTFYKRLLKVGVCFSSDMFVTNPEIVDLLKIEKLCNITEVWTSAEKYKSFNKEQQKLCKGIKLFTDGALGACTAAIESYKVKASPFLTYSDYELDKTISETLDLETQIAIHSIGDIAIGKVIDVLYNHKSKFDDKQVRIEHAQFITLEQAKIAKDLGITLSMQPNFDMDSIVYIDRLNKHYLETNNPFRMLIDDIGFIPGKDLIFGSDGMPTGIDGVIQQCLFPPVPGQKLCIDEFVAGYCSNKTDLGYIELEIDELKRKVSSTVVLS